MSNSDRNPEGKSIRELAGDGRKFRMDSPEEKAAADALLNLTPAELAARIVTGETDLIRKMVDREILNPAQCDLLGEELAILYEGTENVIDAQRINLRPLVEAIVRRASEHTRTRINEALSPRLNPDGSLDFLA